MFGSCGDHKSHGAVGGLLPSYGDGRKCFNPKLEQVELLIPTKPRGHAKALDNAVVGFGLEHLGRKLSPGKTLLS